MRTTLTRIVFARAVGTTAVALCETLIASEPGLPDLTLIVATPAAPLLTAVNLSVLTWILRLPR